MTHPYIDLTRLNPEYKGGATRFAQGLANALPEAVRLRKGERPPRGATVIAPQCRVNFPECKTILCIHDIQHEVHPENFSFPVRHYRRWAYRRAARLAWRIQVSSYAIWRDLEKYIGVRPQKLFFAPEGYDERLWAPELPDRKPLGAPECNFVYYPAGLWKHKNHETVIRGLKNTNIKLVLTGKDYGEWPKIELLAARQNTQLFNLGTIPEIEMRWLYKNAICTIAAGYYESGSLPVKEALACGGNVLAANIEPNRELNGLRNLSLFETFSPSSFAENLAIIPHGRGGWRSINEFRWSNIADIYRQQL